MQHTVTIIISVGWRAGSWIGALVGDQWIDDIQAELERQRRDLEERKKAVNT